MKKNLLKIIIMILFIPSIYFINIILSDQLNEIVIPSQIIIEDRTFISEVTSQTLEEKIVCRYILSEIDGDFKKSKTLIQMNDASRILENNRQKLYSENLGISSIRIKELSSFRSEEMDQELFENVRFFPSTFIVNEKKENFKDCIIVIIKYNFEYMSGYSAQIPEGEVTEYYVVKNNRIQFIK